MKTRVQKIFTKPSRTKQAFKHEVDINRIMAKYQKTGLLPVTNKSPLYGDFSSIPDFETASNKLIAAQNAFDAQPASLRKRFNNNPSELLHFLQDESNRDEAIKLGLVPKPEPIQETKDPGAAPKTDAV
jgi:phage internal scaffolding protein